MAKKLLWPPHAEPSLGTMEPYQWHLHMRLVIVHLYTRSGEFTRQRPTWSPPRLEKKGPLPRPRLGRRRGHSMGDTPVFNFDFDFDFDFVRWFPHL